MAYKIRTAPIPPKEQLETLYNTPMSIRDVAKATGCSVAFIHRLMKEHNIQTRTHSQGLTISLARPEIKAKMRKKRKVPLSQARRQTIDMRIRSSVYYHSVNHIGAKIRGSISGLLSRMKKTPVCQRCFKSPVAHVHHVTPLKTMIIDMLKQGFEPEDVVILLVLAHYTKRITLLPVCVPCHYALHTIAHTS